MGEFSESWLALREPADAAARSSRVVAAVARGFEGEQGLTAVDLGAGTGANLRFLAPRLPMVGRWRLVDHDRALLAAVAGSTSHWGAAHGITVARHDGGIELRHGDHTARVSLVEGDLVVPGSWLDGDVALVTASALLDLVSLRWARAIAERIREAGAAALFALSYDGRLSFDPPHEHDELVRELVNRHQQTDKGFGGPALGPDASATMRALLEGADYHVVVERSDWVLTQSHSALQRELILGWAGAASEMMPVTEQPIAAWIGRRLEWARDGCSQMIVGHDDLAAWPRSRVSEHARD